MKPKFISDHLILKLLFYRPLMEPSIHSLKKLRKRRAVTITLDHLLMILSPEAVLPLSHSVHASVMILDQNLISSQRKWTDQAQVTTNFMIVSKFTKE